MTKQDFFIGLYKLTKFYQFKYVAWYIIHINSVIQVSIYSLLHQK